MNLVTPDSGLIFWMTLIFAIVFVILAKFGFPVITGMVDKRQEKIEGSLRDAQKAREEVEHLQQLRDQMIAEAHTQQAQILSEAAKQRQTLLERSKADAEKQAAQIIIDARTQIESERENAMRQIRSQVSSMSVSIAEKILKKELDRIIRIEKQFKEPHDDIKKIVVDALNTEALSDEDFSKIAESIDQIIDGFDALDMHKLGNLALLSKDDNSAFNNSPFYEKRQMMLNWLNDPQKNIPYSTTKAFLKMYAEQDFSLDFTRWGKSDFDDLFARQSACLKDFIKENEDETN